MRTTGEERGGEGTAEKRDREIRADREIYRERTVQARATRKEWWECKLCAARDLRRSVRAFLRWGDVRTSPARFSTCARACACTCERRDPTEQQTRTDAYGQRD